MGPATRTASSTRAGRTQTQRDVFGALYFLEWQAHICVLFPAGDGAVFRPMIRHYYELMDLSACRLQPSDGAPQALLAQWSVLSRPVTRALWEELEQAGIMPHSSHLCHNPK